MHPNLSTLYNLRLADEHIVKAKQQIQALDWGDAQQKAVVALRSQAAALLARKTDTEKALRSAESDLAMTESRITRSERRISTGEVHNMHEMESTEKELETLRHRRSELEEQALTLMEELEKFPAEAATIRKQEQALLKQRETLRENSTAQKARLEKEIEDAGSRWETLAAEVPAPLLERYKRMRDHFGGTAVSRVISGACGDCRVAIAPSVIKTVADSIELIPCQNCQRILYTEG